MFCTFTCFSLSLLTARLSLQLLRQPHQRMQLLRLLQRPLQKTHQRPPPRPHRHPRRSPPRRLRETRRQTQDRKLRHHPYPHPDRSRTPAPALHRHQTVLQRRNGPLRSPRLLQRRTLRREIAKSSHAATPSLGPSISQGAEIGENDCRPC